MRFIGLRTILALSLATALSVWSAQTIAGAPGTSVRVSPEDSEAVPVITSVAPRATTPSGRLVIRGSGFSRTPGDTRVVIDGLPAIITRRSEAELHAYVPEGVASGNVALRVVGPDGASNAVALQISPRTPDGRILWRFQTDERTSRQFIARAPDGTVYTADGRATYALAPDGALKWASLAASGDSFGARPISLGADGTIYTGVDYVNVNEYVAVVALNPDGAVRWRFIPPTPGDLIIGPNVGPDGNIYAVQDTFFGGLGAFALDPDGNLIWSNRGEFPLDGADLITTSNVVFGTDRLHFGIVRVRSGGNPVIYTFSLDGEQLWTSEIFDVHVTTFPVVDPFDRVILTWGQTGLRAASPAGEEVWFTLHPNGASLVVRPTVASDGTIYSGDFIGVELWALTSAGETVFVRPRGGRIDSLTVINISPDDSILVTGGAIDSSSVAFVRGHSPVNGDALWQVRLLPENGLPQLVSSFDSIFSADSSTVYVTSQFAGDMNDFGYLYAIAAQPGSRDAANAR
jgi:outer membrane protein assembly factor BamB